jgi:hypothetical protein
MILSSTMEQKWKNYLYYVFYNPPTLHESNKLIDEVGTKAEASP